MSHGSLMKNTATWIVTLTRKISMPKITQGSALLTQCIQRELWYDVYYQALEYLVLRSSILQSTSG